MMLEICLLIIGAVAVVLSFVIGEKAGAGKGDAAAYFNVDDYKEEIEQKISEEVDDAIFDKTEDFEVKLEKMANEKFLEIGDYSKTVLSDIDKNHKEVMFLYDMLADKEKDIKNALIDVQNIKKSIEVIKKSSEEKAAVQVEVKEISEEKTGQVQADSYDTVSSEAQNNAIEIHEEETSVKFEEQTAEPNNNDRILELAKSGMSNIAIARELGLGVGEVRLVVDLYKNA